MDEPLQPLQTMGETYFRMNIVYQFFHSFLFLLYLGIMLRITVKYKGLLSCLSLGILWSFLACYAVQLASYLVVFSLISHHPRNEPDEKTYHTLLISTWILDQYI